MNYKNGFHMTGITVLVVLAQNNRYGIDVHTSLIGKRLVST